MHETLKQQLRRHEGVRHTVYQDSVGIWTCGCGRNMQDKGLSDDEIDYLLDNDIDQCVDDLAFNYPWYVHLNRVRQNAMIDMRFNLGSAGFANFRKMIAALEREDYETAAMEMMDSKWSIQVGSRANELAEMVRTGEPLTFV